MWSNIFSPSKLTEIAVAVCRLQFIKNQQNYLKFNITVNFKYTRQVNYPKSKTIFKSSLNPIPAGVLENQDTLGEGVNLTPPL